MGRTAIRGAAGRVSNAEHVEKFPDYYVKIQEITSFICDDTHPRLPALTPHTTTSTERNGIMANETATQLGNAAGKVADVLTGARTDKSGLMSAMIEYMGARNGTGRRILHERARNEGLEPTVRQWEAAPSPAPTQADVVTKLLPADVIDHFSRQTGLSHAATIAGLADLLPHLSRLDG